MAEISKPAVVRFGVFEADPRSGELRKNGIKLKVQDQPFQVLMYLIERSGGVVSREELRQRLWPADTFVDFDHGLNTAINKLRDALGDSATSPRFIETLPRRGYRFIAPVQTVPVQPPSAAPISSATVSVADQVAAASLSSLTEKEVTAAAQSVEAPAKEPLADSTGDLPKVNRKLTRSLFVLAQLMYLVFYTVALLRLNYFDEVVPHTWLTPVLVAVVITAPVGIALRLYLFSAAAFDYRALGRNFGKLFPVLFFLDEIWALSPFLLLSVIGIGGALASSAALIYLPFSQRTLIRMAYERGRES